jgi:Galactose oxidase, central domain
MGTRRARAGVVGLVVVVAVALSAAHGLSGVTSSRTQCAKRGATAPRGCWREVLPLGSGGFPASPGSNDRPLWEPGRFPLTLTPRLAFHDQLWMTAQAVTYSSPDGLEWIQHDKTDWGERIYHSVVYFEDKLWLFGGLDYETRTFLNDIWSSSDGIVWTKVGTAAWSPRGASTMVAYHDQLWLFGGANHTAPDGSTDGFLNDVWSSNDGVAWTQVTDAAAWSPRDNPGVVVLNDRLYIISGQGQADVWRSRNGKDWTRLVAQAPWGPRHGSARLVFGGKLWVLGGFIGTSTNALNDVWYSSDGVTWVRQAEHAPWAPRLPVAIVFRDKIWIYSGKHTGGTDNWGGDLWQMTTAAPPRR